MRCGDTASSDLVRLRRIVCECCSATYHLGRLALANREILDYEIVTDVRMLSPHATGLAETVTETLGEPVLTIDVDQVVVRRDCALALPRSLPLDAQTRTRASHPPNYSPLPRSRSIAARLSRTAATAGCSGPYAVSVMARARSASGRAAATSPSSRRIRARVFRWVATVGWSGPYAVSVMARVRSASGRAAAASPSSCRIRARVFSAMPTVGWSGRCAVSVMARSVRPAGGPQPHHRAHATTALHSSLHGTGPEFVVGVGSNAVAQRGKE